MKCGLQGEKVGEMDVTRQFRGPLIDAYDACIVREKADIKFLISVRRAETTEILANFVAVERMAVGGKQGQAG